MVTVVEPSPKASASRLADAGPVNDPGLPAWWRERQEKAWKEFAGMPLPGRKDENWRFASLKQPQFGAYDPEAPVPAETARALAGAEFRPGIAAAAVAVFANDRLLAIDALPGNLAARGVRWMTLEQAIAEEPELVRKHFLAQDIHMGSEKFVRLHEARCRAGVVLRVPRGVRIEQPLVACHWLAGAGACAFPHTLVLAEENSAVTLVDLFRSCQDVPGFAVSVNDIIAGPGAEVRYLCVQEWGGQVLSVQVSSAVVDRGAASKVFYFNSGAAVSRAEVLSRAVGEGARSEVLGLSLAHGRQEMDQRTLQHHEVPNTWSDLLFKNSLSHRARTIFSGLIRVFPGARQTDAYQTNRNLLLGPDAEADSMPGLEILNDDVKCSHGATTSQIDAESIFYMGARGIPPPEARHLIAIGFCQEVLERFDCPPVMEYLEDCIERKYAATTLLPDAGQEIPETPAGEETDVRRLQGTQ